MKDLAALIAKEVNNAAVEERKREEYSSAKEVQNNVQSKVISTSFLKIEGRSIVIWVEQWRKRDGKENLRDDQNQSLEAPPRSSGGRERGSKEDVRKANAGKVIKKSWGVGITGVEKVREDDPIEYFLPRGSEALVDSQRRW